MLLHLNGMTPMKLAPWVVVVVGVLPSILFAADEEATPEQAAERSPKRLEVFKTAVKNLTAKSDEITDETRLTFPDKPILRYNDEARNFFDAAVWKLGTKGRPTALLTLEMYGNQNSSALLMHEFTSLSDKKFTVDTPLGVHWHPHDTDCQFQPLPDSPAPSASKPQRLAQMRTLSRRFSCDDEWGGQKQELRLLTQPIDRYEDPEAGIVDGAIFAFATGTNPEVLVLIEAGEKGFQYGLARQALAKMNVRLDDKVVFTFPEHRGEGDENDYFSQPYRVEFKWE
jgi:hypothetical protein